MKQLLTALAITSVAVACSSQSPTRVQGKVSAPDSGDSTVIPPGNGQAAPNPESSPNEEPAPVEVPVTEVINKAPDNVANDPGTNEEAPSLTPLDPKAFPPIPIAGGANSILPYRLECAKEGTKYICALQESRSKQPTKLSGDKAGFLTFTGTDEKSYELKFTSDEEKGGTRYHFTLPENSSGTLDLWQPNIFSKYISKARTPILSRDRAEAEEDASTED